jgi:glucosamine 6-phosphate synthetase-like amidotransferase/phosphosugar isomerase protein
MRRCANNWSAKAATSSPSDTDTEVLAHLIGSIYEQIDGADSKARLVNATRAALKQVIGTYGIALVHSDIKEFMIGARRGSPSCSASVRMRIFSPAT